jgi:hypothetical protein
LTGMLLQPPRSAAGSIGETRSLTPRGPKGEERPVDVTAGEGQDPMTLTQRR